jgi:hypothetical protein
VVHRAQDCAKNRTQRSLWPRPVNSVKLGEVSQALIAP